MFNYSSAVVFTDHKFVSHFRLILLPIRISLSPSYHSAHYSLRPVPRSPLSPRWNVCHPFPAKASAPPTWRVRRVRLHPPADLWVVPPSLDCPAGGRWVIRRVRWHRVHLSPFTASTWTLPRMTRLCHSRPPNWATPLPLADYTTPSQNK